MSQAMCSVCGGSGKVYRIHPNGILVVPFETEPCAACKGTGRKDEDHQRSER
jgi:DnaJ-class molecular chaperone